MELVTPDFGLVFWTLFTFLILLVLLKKFAWGPITEAVKSREESIQTAIDEAKIAREEIEKLKSTNEDLLRQARDERDAMLKEAREIRDKMVSEAKDTAAQEANKVMEKGREELAFERKKAMDEIKSEVGAIAIEIAEKVIRENLSNQESQTKLVDKLIKELNKN
ncbi:MAG: F0F1 ATP synthase subunit B [Luteibaculaceae bacterium]